MLRQVLTASRTGLETRPTHGYCAIVMMLLSALCGCTNYRAGNQTLFRTDIRTVYVPVFQSDSYRRNLGEWLTEAVIKEIETKSPYKVVHTSDADSVLY